MSRYCLSFIIAWSFTVSLCVGELKVFESCDTDSGSEQCAEMSTCTFRGCDGRLCICSEDTLPNQDHTRCLKGTPLGSSCNVSSVCIGAPFSECFEGVCRCKDSYFNSMFNGRPTCFPTALGSETSQISKCPNGDSDKCPYDLECNEGECGCPPEERPATEQEIAASPYLYYLCRPNSFKLDKEVDVDGPDCKNITLTSTTTTSTTAKPTKTKTTTTTSTTSTTVPTTTTPTTTTTKPTTTTTTTTTPTATTTKPTTTSTTIPTTSTSTTTTSKPTTTSTTIPATTTSKPTTTSTTIPTTTTSATTTSKSTTTFTILPTTTTTTTTSSTAKPTTISPSTTKSTTTTIPTTTSSSTTEPSTTTTTTKKQPTTTTTLPPTTTTISTTTTLGPTSTTRTIPTTTSTTTKIPITTTATNKPVTTTSTLTSTTTIQTTTSNITGPIGGYCFANPCPENAICVVDSCSEKRCQCELGYATSPNKTQCWKLSALGEPCHSGRICQGPNTQCSDSGICECKDEYELSDTGRWCRLKTTWFIDFPLYGEDCSGGFFSECYLDFEQSCVDGRCRCNEGLRMMDSKDRYAMFPSIRQCRNSSYREGERDKALCKNMMKTTFESDVYDRAKAKIRRIQGAIIGGCVGFVAFVGILIGIFVLIRWKRKGRRRNILDSSSMASTDGQSSRYSFKIPRPFATFDSRKEYDSTQITYPKPFVGQSDNHPDVLNGTEIHDSSFSGDANDVSRADGARLTEESL